LRAQDIIDIHISPRVAAKIWAKHGVSEEEVFEVFENPEVVPEIRGSSRKGDSYLAFGRTLAGRYLTVALYPQSRGHVDVATSRDMADNERARYHRR